MAMLLEKIIELATDTDKPLSTLLRQCVVLGHELNNESLKAWANQELNGYTDEKKMPEYRIVSAELGDTSTAGTLSRPLRAASPGGMEEKHRWAAQTVYLGEPVSAYENNLRSPKSHSLTYPWSADMIVYYQQRFMPGHALLTAWQEVPIGVIAGMLDTIRTRVLNVALGIRKEIGESDAELRRVEPNSEKADKVNHIVINHMYGGTAFVADRQTITPQNIAVGNWQDLRRALLAIGIQEGEIGELSHAIDQDGKTLGTRVKGWIGRNAAKVFDKGLHVGTSVGTTVLTEYVKRHFGM